MAKSCPKCKEVECEECPEWIFTLADLIMCMMGLFVILWVLKTEGKPPVGNTAEDTKLIKMTAAIRDAFGYIPDPQSLDPVDVELIQQKLKGENVPKGPGEGGKTEEDNEGTDGTDTTVQSIREGKMSAVGAALLFDAGTAEPSAAEVKKLRQIVETLKGHRQIVVVKGHTSLDDLPPNATEDERMALSLERARAVAELMVAQGLSREVVRVQGCSVFEPAKRRKFGPEGQVMNRRVEVEVSGQLVEDRQDRPKVPAVPLKGRSEP